MAEKNKLPNDSFNVSIMVTDERIITIDADSQEEAIEKVKQAWENDEIGWDGFVNVKVDFDTWDEDDEPKEPIDWKTKYDELCKKHCLLLELICEDDLEEYMRQIEQS